VEAHLGALALLLLEALADPGGGMAARRLVGAGQLLEAPGQLAHGLQRRVPWRRALLPAFGQALGGQSGETGAQVQRGFVAQRPVAQLLAPVLVIARL